MNWILKLFYSPSSLKRKVLDIVDNIEAIIGPICNERFWINHFRSYAETDPKNLAIWICVKSDIMKEKLSSNDELAIRLRKTLSEHNYPEQAISLVHIGFESQETVDRESNGDWYLHFK